MEQYDISDFLDPRFSYRIARVLHQRWDYQDYTYWETPRPQCGLLLVTEGNIVFHMPDRVLPTNPGDLIFLPKGCRYRVTTNLARDYLINFNTTATDLPNGPIRLLTGAGATYIDRFRQLLELRLLQPRVTFSEVSQLSLLLERIVSDWKSTAHMRKSDILQTALPLLAEDTISVSQIAARCGISENGLRAAFRKAMGVSPLQYRLNCRIAKAQYLLESTDLSLQQIAEALHFYDEAYFCKLFRQKTGYSPREYAKNQKL